ncbi:MAG TPA: ATP-grasp domain-containing protein, partial [Halanaerobiales bacterium]|nr:ATP-grasp domain-containing protein [Halanaerobiales bacterium]
LTKIFKKELNKIGGKLIVTDNSPLAPALYQGDKYYLTPRINDDNYIEKILNICQKEDIKVIIPLLEKSFANFNQARDLFEKSGIKLFLSSPGVIDLCKDKYQLYKYFMNIGIPTPETYLPQQANELKYISFFPLFIKPRSGQGSENTFKINKQEELEFFVNYLDDVVIQEFIEGEEFTVDTLSDLKGNVLSAVPRKRIEVRAGEVSKAVTVRNEKLIDLSVKVIGSLNIIGPANLQAKVLPDGEIKIIEINPRFGGGVPLSYQSGVNYPLLITRMIRGKKIKPFIGEFQDGLTMLRYDTPIFKDINDLKGVEE